VKDSLSYSFHQHSDLNTVIITTETVHSIAPAINTLTQPVSLCQEIMLSLW